MMHVTRRLNTDSCGDTASQLEDTASEFRHQLQNVLMTLFSVKTPLRSERDSTTGTLSAKAQLMN